MSFLLLWSLRALATIAFGGLVALALRRRSAALRNAAFRTILAVAFALPLVGLYAPQVSVPLPAAPEATLVEAPAPTPVVVSQPAWEVIQSESPVAPGIVHPTALPTTSVPLAALILPLYGLGVLALAARWFAGWRRVRRIAHEATPMEGEPDVLLGAIGVPATFGRTILLPTDAMDWPESRRRAAILHERAHLRRRDWLWQTLAALFAALHWFNPAAWLLSKALRDTAEAAADDEVLAAGLAPSAYARELLAVAKSAGSVGPALAMARRGGVKDRIAEVLSTRRDRRRPTRRLTAALFAITAATGVGIAGITTVKASEPLEAEPQSVATFAGPVRLKDGRTLRLVALHDRLLKDDTWSPSGERIVSPQIRRHFPAPPKDVSGIELTPGKGQRRLQAALLLSGSNGDFQMTLKPPIDTSWTLLAGPDAVSRSGMTTRAEFFVPKGAKTFDLRAGYACGKFRETAIEYRLEKAGSSLFEKGRNQPLVRVHLIRPFPPLGEHRVVAYDKAGHPLRELASGSDTRPFFDYVSAVPPAKVVLLTRPYQWVTFRGLASFPAPAVKATASPITPQGERPELAWVAEGERVWRNDGTIDKAVRAPKLSQPTKSGWRRIALGFRMPASNSDKSSIISTVWSKYAYPSDGYRIEAASGGREGRIAWCSVQLRPDVKSAKIGVDIFVPDWRTDVDTVPGNGPGEAKIVKGRVTHDGVMPHQTMWVSFPGVQLPGPDRYAELRVYGEGAQPRSTYVRALPFGPDGSYNVIFPASERVRRLVLRSCSIQHLRFDEVVLWPR